MFNINIITPNEVVNFAAQELKKYLRMMMPNNGDITITYTKAATDSYNLGLMQDLDLDVSDVENTELDDILYIDTTAEGGVIAGDNPRSVLLAVYEFLRQNGCRWLFPGVDGEYIPMKQVCAVKYRHKPSMRYRGPCIEGAASQQILLETLDFMPKVGMNVFQMQFLVPTVFYTRYYEHRFNSARAAEPLSDATMLQWKTACETEMSKRGIQFHDVGHGWTVAPFGVDTSAGWESIPDESVPNEGRKYLALLNGKRELFKGVPLNTQFCMSSPEARKKVAEYIADYASVHTNVDYLHVWLGDSCRNHCECDECVKKTVSDWYVMLLNDIDEALTARKLNTRIVFIQYTETTWAPLTEQIKNPDRFTMMLAPISRSYTRSLTGKKPEPLPPFTRNTWRLTPDLDMFMEFFKEWRKTWKGACLSFEYHFWRHQNFEPSGMLLAKRIYTDIEDYKANGVNGLIACGSQRSYFPTGFAYYVFARKQFDISLSFEELTEDYFTVAFGDNWNKFVNFLYEIANCFGDKYLEKEESSDTSVSHYYNPKRAEKLKAVKTATENVRNLISENYNSPDRIRTASVRILEEYADYCDMLAEVFINKAGGDTEKAKEAFEVMVNKLNLREPYIERYFDHAQAVEQLKGLLNS